MAYSIDLPQLYDLLDYNLYDLEALGLSIFHRMAQENHFHHNVTLCR